MREPARDPRTLARGASLAGLRLRRGTVSWRADGRGRRRALADASCALRRGARSLLAGPELVVSARTVETTFEDDPLEDNSSTRYWSCLVSDGRQRLIGTGGTGFGHGASLGGFAARGRYLGYGSFRFDKGQGSSDSVVVRNLRTGVVVGEIGPVGSRETIRLAGLDPRGRMLAVVSAAPPGTAEELVALTGDRRAVVLDPAAAGAITETSLAPDGTATWRRAGEPRSARVP